MAQGRRPLGLLKARQPVGAGLGGTAPMTSGHLDRWHPVCQGKAWQPRPFPKLQWPAELQFRALGKTERKAGKGGE